jgi:DNA-directed RNA polymerase subunit RPC12/RpoP
MSEPTYECPQCGTIAPWTDGIEGEGHGRPDEFWCQTCGAETLLKDMRRVE